jgi:heme exporter protein A
VKRIHSIEAENITCERGGRVVFRALGFRAAEATLLTLEGPNGSGKTSALRLLAGLLPQASGHVRFHTDSGIIEDNELRGRAIAWLGHQDGIKAQLTVGENARFFAQLYRGALQWADALERVGLARLAELPAHYLSAGQRRRLGLARLLLSGRSIWLLDEPLSALDSDGKRLATELIAHHLAQGGIAIAATHDPIGVPGMRVTLGGAL